MIKRAFICLFMFISLVGSEIALGAESDTLSLILNLPNDTAKVSRLVKASTQLRKKGDLKRSLDLANAALEVSEEIMWERGLGLSYGAIGTSEFQMGNHATALEWQLKALKVREKLGDLQGKSVALTNIGLAYHGMGKFAEALRFLDSSMVIKKKIGDKRGLIAVYNNRGMVLGDLGRLEEALEEYGHSLVLGKEVKDDFGTAYAYNNLGSVYSLLKWHKEALNAYKSSLEIKRKLGERNLISACYGNISYVFLVQNKVDLAKAYADSALEVSLMAGNKDLIFSHYRLLSKIDSAFGNYNGALKNFRLHMTYKDSVLNEENRRKMIASQLQYDFDKKANQTKLETEKQDLVTSLASARQQRLLYIAGGGLTIALILVAFIVRSIRDSRRKSQIIQMQKIELETKQKEILESIRYARRIQLSLIPSEKRVWTVLKRLGL